MAGSFQLIDLSSNIAFTFQFFPEKIRANVRANWEPQNTTVGVKPLFYGNTEPQKISVEELYLDNTDTNRSLKDDILDLGSLIKEVDDLGSPPPLLAIWGDSKFRCVLTDVTIEGIMYNDEGNCIRARISIELTQLQRDGESTTVNVDPGT